MSEALRHLAGCPENPRTETYRAGRRMVTRCVDCGDHLVVEATTPDPTAAVFDPDRNPNHPAAGVTMRHLTYDDLRARHHGGVVDMTPTPQH